MRRAFQWDLARQVERLDVLLGLLPRYADWGYEEVYLHLEDAVDYPSLPGVARADAYRWSDLQRLVAHAAKVGIGVVPIVNLLGHTQYLIKTPEWRDLNERRDARGEPLPNGQICPLHPRTPDVMTRLLKDTIPLCTAGKIHVGLDESFHLGQCPRCREEVSRVGLAGHFAAHVHRIHALLPAGGPRLGLWADMLALFPEAIPQLPSGIIAYDWYYYSFPKKPRLELHNFRDYDLVPALRQRGITWWACPMNGAFRYEPLPRFRDRFENLQSWWTRAQDKGAEGFLITSWEAYRLALASPTLVDAAAASLWLESEKRPGPLSLAQGLARLARQQPGAIHRKQAARLSLGDKYPFSGYYEWEAHARWDGGATLERHGKLRRALAELSRSGPSLPPPLEASLQLRLYFAKRALFLREAADVVARLRQALGRPRPARIQALALRHALRDAHLFAQDLGQAVKAAEQMWLASRSRAQPSQNRALLRDDMGRLHVWLNWLANVVGNPAAALDSSPVWARWRLSFSVENFAPAVQRVSVEAQSREGSWQELAFRHTIEFQTEAALRNGGFTRPFSVGIESLDTPVRLVVKGCGQVRIKDLCWSDGVQKLRAEAPLPFVLGKPAPRHGLPDLTAVGGVREVRPARQR